MWRAQQGKTKHHPLSESMAHPISICSHDMLKQKAAVAAFLGDGREEGRSGGGDGGGGGDGDGD